MDISVYLGYLTSLDLWNLKGNFSPSSSPLHLTVTQNYNIFLLQKIQFLNPDTIL